MVWRYLKASHGDLILRSQDLGSLKEGGLLWASGHSGIHSNTVRSKPAFQNAKTKYVTSFPSRRFFQISGDGSEGWGTQCLSHAAESNSKRCSLGWPHQDTMSLGLIRHDYSCIQQQFLGCLKNYFELCLLGTWRVGGSNSLWIAWHVLQRTTVSDSQGWHMRN